MKAEKSAVLFLLCTAVTGAGLLLWAPDALAADGNSNWRPVFDVAMRWLNFAILVFIIVKYGRKPIKQFFSGKREEIALEIEKIEKEKEAAEQKINEAQAMLFEGKERFAQLKERIVEEGEKRKQQIIEDARQESRILLESARKRVDSRFIEAKQAFKSELAEMAISLAAERLPREVTEEDNQKWSNDFIASVSQK